MVHIEKWLNFEKWRNFLSFLVISTEKKNFLQIDSKWSETCKKHETADPSADAAADRRRRRRPIFPVEYVNTSYHTTFHQNISINVACMHKRVLVP